MDRRKFLHYTGVTGAMALAAPSVFSSSLMDKRNMRPVNKIIVVILSGGVRRKDFLDVWSKQESDKVWQQYRLYTGMQYKLPEISHYAGHQSIYDALNIHNASPVTYIPESRFIRKTKENLKQKISHTGFIDASVIHSTANPLSVVHIEGFDVAHYDMSRYYQQLETAVRQCGQLWSELQNNTATKENTLFIVTTDTGRNDFYNDLQGLDHYDNSARDIFCLVAGPSHIIPQPTVDPKMCDHRLIGSWMKQYLLHT